MIYQAFQVTQLNEARVSGTIDAFLAAGWVYRSTKHMGGVKFIFLGWHPRLGNPVYPEEHQPDKQE